MNHETRHTVTGPLVILFFCLTFLASCAPFYFTSRKPPEEPFRITSIEDLPYRELWQGFVFNGEKVGFTHLTIEPIPESAYFLITSQAHLKILFLGTYKEIALKGEDVVRPDLTLVSFNYEQHMGGKEVSITGEVKDGEFHATQNTDGRTKALDHILEGPLFPASVINLYPVLRGMQIGATYGYTVFDPQTQSFAGVHQRITAFEESKILVVEPSFKVETTLHEHTASTWINLRGEAIFELGMGGVLITCKETEEEARRYVLEAGLNKRDLILDFSLIKTDVALPCPRKTTYLEVAIEGIGGILPLLQGPGQEARSPRDGNGTTTIYRVQSDLLLPSRTNETLSEKDRYLFTAPTPHMECHHPDIRKTGATITAGTENSLEKIRTLARWVSREIQDEAVDSSSALDVLNTRKGECQAHTMLYAALARAQGIPTRLVGGLVYMKDLGFLFHNWAESYVDGWLAVDPTFNQVGVDATHIKLVEGPFWTSLLKLGNVVGRLKAKIITYLDDCKKRDGR